MNRRDEIRRKSTTSDEPAMKPPHDARLLENVPILRSTRSSRPKARRNPRRAPQDADRVCLVDHQAGAVALAERDDLRQVADVALHREDTVDHHEDPAAVVGALQHALELRHLVVPEGADLAPEILAPSRIEAWSASRRSRCRSVPGSCRGSRRSPGGPW